MKRITLPFSFVTEAHTYVFLMSIVNADQATFSFLSIIYFSEYIIFNSDEHWLLPVMDCSLNTDVEYPKLTKVSSETKTHPHGYFDHIRILKAVSF